MNCTCIVCRKTLPNIMEDGNQPSGGVAFSSPGHYGSGVFDPMDGSCIEINVCDECLLKAGQEQIVCQQEIVRHRQVKTYPWAPHSRS